ncbi:zinc finger protein 541 isoform X2 [Struthio camelus]|uniref:zinc finger protein 541 isoform X2 n=1 Tax=Struthio camelus TaxID=8801 RepID=UPI003603EBAB
MDQYHFSDEITIHSEMHLPGFSESQGLNCSDTLNHDLCLNTKDMTYAGLSGLDMVPGLSAADMASDTLEANLNGLSLYSVKDCDSVKLLEESDSDSQPSLRELGLPTLSGSKEVEQGGRSSSGTARKGKHQHNSPQTSFLDCSLCGKVFSSASSLSKHYLTHSQERKHVCRICSKAFKRQDHLSGHMLTHQKTKPFMCSEKGCTKSYCDHRSLRRHYEVQHGLCVSKETPDEDGGEESLLSHSTFIQAGQGSVRATERLAVHSESKSDSSPPSRDLLRCIVNNFVNQKLPSAPLSSAEHTNTDLTGSWPPCSSSASQVSCIASSASGLVEAAGGDILKNHLPCQKSAASSNVYAIINPGNVSVIAPGENIVTNLTDRSLMPEPQFPLEPTGLEYCPNNTLPCFPMFRGQKTSANSYPPSGNFQWMKNMPVCAKNKRNSVCVAHKPSVVAQDVSEGLAGPSHTFSAFPQTYECPDTLSFTVAPFKTEEEMLGESALGCSEETFRSARSHESHLWESCGELNFQDIQKQNVFQSESSPLVRQLVMKSQESVVSQEQVQVQQHLFQMITKSQHILSHAQMVAPSQLVTSEAKHMAPKPLQTVFQQPPHLTHHLSEPTEYEGSSTYLQKSITQFQKDILSDSEERGQQTVPTFQSLQPGLVKECVGLKDASIPSQLQSAMHDNAMGYHSYGKSNQLENKPSVSNRKEKSKGCSKEMGGKTQSGVGRSRRLPGIRKEKLKFDMTCAASPSQVAMASFSSSGPSSTPVFREKPRLTIFNRIQGGNIYSLTNTVKEESLSAGCNKASSIPADGGKYESDFLCKNCSQLFYTEKGLESHMCFHGEQWYSPERKEEQQVHDAENVNVQKLLLKPTGDGNSPSRTEMHLEDVTVAPLVIPVSVPVTTTNPQAGNEVNEEESQDAKDLKESLHQKKRKRQTRPKSLFIPPPPSSEVQPGMGGCYQSNLRSPVFLVDHLLRDLFQCSPYTPPPMLSPIREGSGLYFSTLCSSANGDPNQLFSTVLDRMDRDFGFCLVKDNTKISIEPHINIGSRFQADIPNLQDRSYLENDEQAASLVWKPWGDIATNQETQDRVTELLNMACSSVMPGGGTNLELALHCLHEAQGNVLEALEMLLFGGPQKSESHPLANYRYAGSDVWTPVERQLFKKAFCVHKKDFYLIQKKIQTKNVSQCVEYYYIWKKIIKFDYSRVQVIEKKVKKDKNELEKTEEKTACSPPKRHGHLPKESMKMKQKSYKKMPHSTWSPSCSLKGSPYQSGSTDDQCAFPCRECERVFDKIKSRNAHMKCHRLQEQVEPLMKIKWPLKHFKNEAKMEETQTMTSSSGNWETTISE